MSSEKLQLTFICLNWGRSYEHGSLVLPSEFFNEYRQKLSDVVYLHVPSGKTWHGNLVKETGIIEGLDSLVAYHGLGAYNVPLLQYTGGSEFILRIFNCYAVEIEYSVGNMGAEKNVVEKGENAIEVEVAKLSVAFKLNAYNPSENVCEVKIQANHLVRKQCNHIISKDEVRKLKIDESMKYVDIGFANKMWKTQLILDDDDLVLGHGWNDFAEASKLLEGDICCFQGTNVKNKLEVVIFHMQQIAKWNPPIGEELCLSRTLFLHISNEESLNSGEIVIPRVFFERYGMNLKDNVTLWMADDNTWITALSRDGKCITGCKRMLNYYSVSPEYKFVFYYFGDTTFYVSILGPNGVDILNRINEKRVLEDVVMANRELISSSLSESTEEADGDDHTNYGMVGNSEELSDEEDREFQEENLEQNSEMDNNMFLVTLRISHFDSKSHGVYVPKTLKNFYEKWKKGKLVTLCYKGKFWKVKGNAASKQCRLGKGWRDFIGDNAFVVGQKIKFQYVGTGNLIFEVTN